MVLGPLVEGASFQRGWLDCITLLYSWVSRGGWVWGRILPLRPCLVNASSLSF